MTEEALDRQASLIWCVAGLLRGVCRQADYQKVGLLLVVLRRLDCVLEAPKGVVLGRCVKLKDRVDTLGRVLLILAGEQFYNASPLAVSWDSAASPG